MEQSGILGCVRVFTALLEAYAEGGPGGISRCRPRDRGASRARTGRRFGRRGRGCARVAAGPVPRSDGALPLRADRPRR
eukprot:5143611-Lingulodinium_polyedra.AAC.1